MLVNRILSGLLALVLLLGAVPKTAFASETDMPVVPEEPTAFTESAAEETEEPQELPATEVVQVVKELEPGIFTTEEQVIAHDSQNDGIMVAADLPQLTKPTNLKWHIHYNYVWNAATQLDDVTSSPLKGSVGFVRGAGGENLDVQWYTIRYYKGEKLWATRRFGMNPSYDRISDFYFLLSDPTSGTYHFTVQMDGDGVTCSDSIAAKSASWTYKKPTSKLSKCTSPTWKAGSPSFTPPADTSYVGGYQISYYYASTKNDTPREITRAWSYGSQMPNFTLLTYATEHCGAGYYYFKVRAFSSDISTVYNSDWSKLSTPIYYSETPELYIDYTSAGVPNPNWRKVSGASSYNVYRANYADGKYTLLGNTKTTSWEDFTAVKGQRYLYKITAVMDGAEGVCSNVVYGVHTIPRAKITVSTNTTSGKPVIKWKTVDEAQSYVVWVYGGEYSQYTRLTQTTKLTYTHTTAKAGTEYWYVVSAIGTIPWTDSDSLRKSIVCDLKRPSITLSTNSSTGKTKISWKAIDGAEEYKVYYATSKNGTYKRLTTTNKTYTTHTSAKAGTTYYYKVKAIHENSAANSAYSSYKYRTCDLPRPDVEIALKKGDPRLTWDKIDGARKYEIYRATSKDGKFTLLKTVTGTSFTNTSAKAGKTYYYKVKAIHSKSAANSAYSSTVSIKAK